VNCEVVFDNTRGVSLFILSVKEVSSFSMNTCVVSLKSYRSRGSCSQRERRIVANVICRSIHSEDFVRMLVTSIPQCQDCPKDTVGLSSELSDSYWMLALQRNLSKGITSQSSVQWFVGTSVRSL
jgi:hypothetical protein